MGLLGSAVSVGRHCAEYDARARRVGRAARRRRRTRLPSAPRSSHAQDARIRAQRDTLERIRREREELEQRAAELQTTVHDLNEEVANLDRRADATARIVKTLDAQLAIDHRRSRHAAATKVNRTENELAAKKTSLHRRLVDIYKRGPLYTTEAMLSARSFGELVARYKYLHLLALRDRSLVDRVEQLRDQVARDHDRLLSLQNALEERPHRQAARGGAPARARARARVQPRHAPGSRRSRPTIASRSSRRPRRR